MRNRSNEDWLTDLLSSDQSEALEDLRAILTKGLRFALASRVFHDNLDAQIEDFVQDALIRILDNLATFRGESKFTTWAQKITIRVAYSELRRQRWKDISLEDLQPEDSGDFTPSVLADKGPDPEQKASQQMMLELAQRLVIEELTERQRTAMHAVMAGSMPLEEVARRMGTNRNALYKLIHDARKRLQKKLLEEGLTPQELLSVFDIDRM